MNAHFWWYVARSSGVIAWLLLTASVLWGVVLSTKAFPEHRRPAWLLDLHRWLGGLTVGFVAIHLIALLADSSTTFTVADLAIPYVSDWKPGAVALGVVAAWGLAAVEITSLAIRHLPRRVWRGIHLVSYLTFWLTSLHAAFAGTDRSQVLYQATAAISVALVAWAVVYRLTHQKAPRRARAAGAAATRSTSTPASRLGNRAGAPADERSPTGHLAGTTTGTAAARRHRDSSSPRQTLNARAHDRPRATP